MQSNLSPDLENAINFAFEEAAAFGSKSVRCEHLLIGLVRLAKCEHLQTATLKVHDVRRVVETLNGESYNSQLIDNQKLDFDEPAQTALLIAQNIVNESEPSQVQPDHLLLALASEFCETSREVLQRLGVDLNLLLSPFCALEALFKQELLSNETLRERIRLWSARAEMAREQGRQELVNQALKQKAEYEQRLRNSLRGGDSDN